MQACFTTVPIALGYQGKRVYNLQRLKRDSAADASSRALTEHLVSSLTYRDRYHLSTSRRQMSGKSSAIGSVPIREAAVWPAPDASPAKAALPERTFDLSNWSQRYCFRTCAAVSEAVPPCK